MEKIFEPFINWLGEKYPIILVIVGLIFLVVYFLKALQELLYKKSIQKLNTEAYKSEVSFQKYSEAIIKLNHLINTKDEIDEIQNKIESWIAIFNEKTLKDFSPFNKKLINFYKQLQTIKMSVKQLIVKVKTNFKDWKYIPSINLKQDIAGDIFNKTLTIENEYNSIPPIDEHLPNFDFSDDLKKLNALNKELSKLNSVLINEINSLNKILEDLKEKSEKRTNYLLKLKSIAAVLILFVSIIGLIEYSDFLADKKTTQEIALINNKYKAIEQKYNSEIKDYNNSIDSMKNYVGSLKKENQVLSYQNFNYYNSLPPNIRDTIERPISHEIDDTYEDIIVIDSNVIEINTQNNDILQFKIKWLEGKDIDLHLYLPSGEEISFRNMTSNQMSIFLNRDYTSSPGNEVITLRKYRSGKYKLKINNYSRYGTPKFELIILKNNEHIISKTIRLNKEHIIKITINTAYNSGS